MSNNYYDATGVIVLNNVTPVIKALFGAFNLDESQPGDGQVYIASMSESDEPTWDEIHDGLASLASDLNLPLPDPANESIQDYLRLLAQHFGTAEDVAFNKLLDTYEFEGGASLRAVFALANHFDDGHGLKAMKLEGCWHGDRPRLFEFGGDGLYVSRNVRYSVDSSTAKDFGNDLEQALTRNDLDAAAKHLALQVEKILGSVVDTGTRAQLENKLAVLMTEKLGNADLSTMLRDRRVALAAWGIGDALRLVQQDAELQHNSVDEVHMQHLAQTLLTRVRSDLEQNFDKPGSGWVATHWEELKDALASTGQLYCPAGEQADEDDMNGPGMGMS
ncbi:hypothetical protein [Massilia alkalitolerans]|uniref:hypothetical protein n=1 Tax=Massilia alkalitolerans TaxID=286638 RepID=UPI00041314E3|nr:hypothetical protein [Massilia alkalitolerans]